MSSTLRRRRPTIVDPWYLVLREITSSLEQARDRYIEAPAVILDIGCGDMPYYPIFASVASDYFGTDIQPGPLITYVCPAEELTVPDASVDLVLSTQVLEHVRNPHRALQEIARVLRPGGYAFVTTHGVWPFHPHPTDYWRWTQQGFEALFQDVDGLELVELAPHGGTVSCFATLINHYIRAFAGRLHSALGWPLIALINVAGLIGDCAVEHLRFPNPDTLIVNYLAVARRSV
jgi:SAM-dependent methyltransferase